MVQLQGAGDLAGPRSPKDGEGTRDEGDGELEPRPSAPDGPLRAGSASADRLVSPRRAPGNAENEEVAPARVGRNSRTDSRVSSRASADAERSHRGRVPERRVFDDCIARCARHCPPAKTAASNLARRPLAALARASSSSCADPLRTLMSASSLPSSGGECASDLRLSAGYAP